MNRNEAASQLGEGTHVKLIATLIPPLMLLWIPNKEGDPRHMKVAYQKGLCTKNPLILKGEVRAGRAKVENGELILTGGSLDYIQNMPSPEEFEILINGDIQIIEI